MKLFCRLFLFLLLIISASLLPQSFAVAADYSVNAVYFYSPTCESCRETGRLIDQYQKMHKDLHLVKYNITNLKNKDLLNRYDAAYHVGDNAGTVPILFAGDRYYSEVSSLTELEQDLKPVQGKALKTIPGVSSVDTDQQRITGYSCASVFAAGLVNGLNPCSMSMALFFLSLLAIERKKIIKTGAMFCAGKFTGYLALGTILFGALSKLSLFGLKPLIKAATMVLLLFLILLNVKDCFSARKEQYGKIVLQLPSRLKKWNHGCIRKVSETTRMSVLLLLSFALGAVLSLGEFLCTGQIYLVTIVTVLQKDSTLSLLAFFYLVIYDLAYLIPLAALVAAVAGGKEVFELSEFVREHMPAVKIINAVLLLAFGVVLFII